MTERLREGQVWVLRQPDSVLLAGAALILLQTIVRARIVLPSYFWADDYLHVGLAREVGLTRDFLIREYNGHLEIGANFLYWLIGRDAGLSFLPAALSLLVMQLIASCLLLAVLRQLFGRSPWILVPFAAYLFTPLALTASTWWAAGLEALPLQIAMFMTLLGAVHWVRERSWRWGAFALAGQVLGLVFWQKAVLILPTVVGVLLLVEWTGRPIRTRLRLLVGCWRLLLPQAVAIGAYLVLYLSVVDSSKGLSASAEIDVTASGDTIFRLLLPGVLGGPWSDSGAENTIFPYVGNALATVCALLFLGVVAASVWLRGRRAVDAWLLVVGYLAVDLALVQLGRAELLGLISRDPRYVTDALAVIAIGVCAAFSGPAAPRRRFGWTTALLPRAAASTSSALSAASFLIASSLITSFLVADNLQHEYSRNYVNGVVRAMAENPGVSVLSTPTPMNVALTADLGYVLRAVGEEQPMDQPGTDVRMFDGLGNLRTITVTDPALDETGPVEGCGWQVDAAWQSLGRISDPVSGPQILQLGVMTGQPATLHIAVGGTKQALALEPGLAQATFVITGQEGQVQARVSDVAEGGLCLVDAVAGTPWPAD